VTDETADGAGRTADERPLPDPRTLPLSLSPAHAPARRPPSFASPAEAGELPDGCLLVDTYGAFLGRHSERLRLSLKGETLVERPLLGLEHVLVLAGGVSLSADAVRGCAEAGVPISFISRGGKSYAKLVSPELTGTVQTRRHQLLAFLDERGAHLAKAFARGKLLNQAALLKYMAKYRRATDPPTYELAREAAFRLEHLAARIAELPGASADAIRQDAMNLEARGARHYWEAARALVRADPSARSGQALDWASRQTRGAQDLVNQCLNYGYGILYAQVERAILLAALDPYAGYLHEDRPGKPSLALDLVEEFRQPVVDRVVFALLNQRVSLAQDPSAGSGQAGRLDDQTRTTLAKRVNERLETEELYAHRKLRLRTIIQSQARRLAVWVRGEGKAYEPWVARW
jgi:CRISP-associated protein Cas1